LQAGISRSGRFLTGYFAEATKPEETGGEEADQALRAGVVEGDEAAFVADDHDVGERSCGRGMRPAIRRE
jgi:hypothetical protein